MEGGTDGWKTEKDRWKEGRNGRKKMAGRDG